MHGYILLPEPTHMNAPDAWAVYRRGDDEAADELIAHGINLDGALEEIRFDVQADDSDELADPLEQHAEYLNETGRSYQ